MRHTFELSKQTINVLSGDVKNISLEADVCDKFIYAILAGTETDPFAKFYHLYAACVRAGADVSPWDARLSAVRSKYRVLRPHSVVECLSEKLRSDTETTDVCIKALHDGAIDAREHEELSKLIEIERQTLDKLETAMECPKANYGGRVSTRTREEVKPLVNGRNK